MIHTKYQCIPASGLREDFWRFIRNNQNLHYFAPYWAPNGEPTIELLKFVIQVYCLGLFKI